MNNECPSGLTIMSAITFSIVLIVGTIALGMVGCPKYAVYNQRMEGEALLAKSLSSKQVSVSEARAKMEAASLLAQAEVERAKGVAAANKIIGESLRENEAYLRYLWITEVANQNEGKTVVYIPTEANLPILEAQRIGGAK